MKLYQIYIVLSCIGMISNSIYGIDSNNQLLKYNLIDGLPDIYLSPESEKIGVTWNNGYVWDKSLIKLFYSLLPLHDECVVFDLGAQTGSFTLLAKFFPNSTWYAFEPLEEAINTLKQNIKFNNIQNVLVYQKAASNFCGKATLNMPSQDQWGCATIGDNPLRYPIVEQRDVECITLDSFIEEHNIKKVHFMKIDTEGAELLILHGAKKLIQRDHPILLLEYNETNMKQCHISTNDLHQFLKDMGYTWELVSEEDILCIPVVS